MDSGFHNDAVRCLWNAGSEGWDELARTSTSEQLGPRIECSWAAVIVNGPVLSDALRILKRFCDSLGDDSFCEQVCTEPVWSDAIRALLTPLMLSKARPAEGDNEWVRCAAILDTIKKYSIQLPAEASGYVYFLAKRYSEAISMWDRGNVKPPPYHRAKASVAPYPEQIISLASLHLYGEIATAHDANPESPLTDEQASAVADALRDCGRLEDAFVIAAKYRLSAPMLRVSSAALKQGLQAAAKAALLSGVSLLIDRGEWNVVLPLFRSKREFYPTVEWKQPQLQKLFEVAATETRDIAIRAAARSRALSEAPDVQKEISTYLRKYLRVKDGDWRSHIQLSEAGAALERGGRFTDAILFYEAVANDNTFSRLDHLFAWQRWLVNKQRQLIYERAHGAAAKVQQITHDLETQKQAMKISSIDTELPEYPVLEPLVLNWPGVPVTSSKGPVAPPSIAKISASAGEELAGEDQEIDPVVFTTGTLKFEYSRKLNRCNIVDVHTMAQGYIKISERKCGGEVEFSNSSDHHWVCSIWKLVIRFPADSSQALSIEMQDSGIQVHIPQRS